MKKVRVNPGQTPVIVGDQPLFAICKTVQWDPHTQFNENNFFVMMGGLHIEQLIDKIIGDWLKDSGWAAMLIQADVITSGKAESILRATNITRSRYCHQISAVALAVLRNEAYGTYCLECQNKNKAAISIEEWISVRKTTSPLSRYWQTGYELEMLLLQFFGATRLGDLDTYIMSLVENCGWSFLLDHYHYARWLPVHIRDLLNLDKTHPEIYKSFLEDKTFTVNKTTNPFSRIALDHNHEQNNKAIKEEGGAIRLVVGDDEDDCVLTEFCVTCTERSRLIKEFEMARLEHPSQSSNTSKHHDQSPSVQRTFLAKVESLLEIYHHTDNPFMDDTKEIYRLDTKEVMPELVNLAVMGAEAEGRRQYAVYVQTRLVDRDSLISDSIKMNKLHLPGNLPKLSKSCKERPAKEDVHLLGQLYIAAQVRDSDTNKLFAHENADIPPSLSKDNKLRGGHKADLITCLDDGSSSQVPPSLIDVTIIDGAAMVHRLKPGSKQDIKTFGDYSENFILPYLEKIAENCKRLDIIWDIYKPDSLKNLTRDTRGAGTRRIVTKEGPIPPKWDNFLNNSENKSELFELLSHQIAKHSFPSGTSVITTLGENVLVNPIPYPIPSVRSEYPLSPCSQEEFGTRALLHAANASEQGYNRILIQCNDTDVIVLSLHFFSRIDVDFLWLTFGVGKHLRYFPIHEMTKTMSPSRLKALPAFLALTGSDTTSFISGCGKVSAMRCWEMMPEVTLTFCNFMDMPETISDEDLAQLEQFVILLYSRSCPYEDVNSARKYLFGQTKRGYEYIPPTKSALVEHAKRAVFQAGYVWGQSLTAQQILPSPSLWGWTPIENNWIPYWTQLPRAVKAMAHLMIRCKCSTRCTGNCTCSKEGVDCTDLCKCGCSCYVRDKM